MNNANNALSNPDPHFFPTDFLATDSAQLFTCELQHKVPSRLTTAAVGGVFWAARGSARECASSVTAIVHRLASVGQLYPSSNGPPYVLIRLISPLASSSPLVLAPVP